MSKLARTILVAAIVAGALMAASASPVGASVTIGQLAPGSPPPTACGNQSDRLTPNVTSGNSYVVPSNGAITSWSHNAAAGPGQLLTMKIFRKVSSPFLSLWTAVGHDGPRPLVGGALNTFPASVAVKAGDVLGANSANAPTVNNACLFLVPGEPTHFFRIGDLADGETGAFNTNTGARMNISAVLEPDCDNDGLGDETQDTNLSTCPAGTTPTGPITGPGGAPVTCQGVNATIAGTAGNDVRIATPGKDVIAGLGGNDKLSGLAGTDLICGGKGKDTLNGGKGKDKLYGQAGNDTLNGGGNIHQFGFGDRCTGGKGKDKAKNCEKTKSI
jgi:Ca2+-binding RTX toxin-like protein